MSAFDSEMVLLRGRFNQDEVNHAGASYKVSAWHTVLVPQDAVPPLLKTGGFHIADDDDEAVNSTVEEVAFAAWHLPKGAIRDAVLDFIDGLPDDESKIVHT